MCVCYKLKATISRTIVKEKKRSLKTSKKNRIGSIHFNLPVVTPDFYLQKINKYKLCAYINSPHNKNPWNPTMHERIEQNHDTISPCAVESTYATNLVLKPKTENNLCAMRLQHLQNTNDILYSLNTVFSIHITVIIK